jgi:hypothetical protein
MAVPELNHRLPVLLQPGELSPRFSELVRTDVAWDPHNSMFVGTAILEVLNSVGRLETFAIPNPYDTDVRGPAAPPPQTPWQPRSTSEAEGEVAG